jgi:hypothetical protein
MGRGRVDVMNSIAFEIPYESFSEATSSNIDWTYDIDSQIRFRIWNSIGEDWIALYEEGRDEINETSTV